MFLLRLLILLTVFLSLLACQPEAYLQSSKIPEPGSQPILQLDSGGHQGIIQDVIFTQDGRYLVSAGKDKVIRVWDVSTGKTVRTLRGQIGVGEEGNIFAMALSPDGQWLAAGGLFPGKVVESHAIRLYNFASGNIVALLKGHTNAVKSLAFSPDSRLLVSGQGGRSSQIAIIWDISQGKQLHTLRGHIDRIYAVAFTQDSKRVVTGSFDKTLRLWRVEDGGLIATLKGHSDKVRAVTISPQDGYITSGSWDQTIRLWNGQTGQLIKTLANQGSKIGSLSFSPDGRYLVSGVSADGDICNVWSYPSGRKLVGYKGHDNIVLATAVSPDGRWAATGSGDNQDIHIWSLRDGKLKTRLSGTGRSIWAVGFSANSKELAWGKTAIEYYNQAGKLEYSMALPSQGSPLGAPSPIKYSRNFVRAQEQWRDWSLRTREGGKFDVQAILEISYQNRPVANIERGSTNGYDHRSYTFTPDGQRIISGGMNGIITVFKQDGSKKFGDYVGHTDDIWALAVSPDGRLLASASHDQTIRLWNVKNQENLLSIFQGDNGEWVAWTQSGYYTASPNGGSMIGWQINYGVDNAADYVTAAQLRDHFHRPDIVDNTIRLLSEQKALAKAGAIGFSLEQLNAILQSK